MERPSRKQIRLPDYDYSQAGAYFVTICTQKRAHLFGAIAEAGSEATERRHSAIVSGFLAEILESTWLDLQNHNTCLYADKFVVMPNHIHGIICIERSRAGEKTRLASLYEPAPTKALSEIVRQFKTFSARRINESQKTPGCAIWQRGYYEHIIRNEQDYLDVWQYIDNNPAKWAEDIYNK